jgi:hypothetical protein
MKRPHIAFYLSILNLRTSNQGRANHIGEVPQETTVGLKTGALSDRVESAKSGAAAGWEVKKVSSRALWSVCADRPLTMLSFFPESRRSVFSVPQCGTF